MAKKTLEELNVQDGDQLIIKGKVAFSEVANRVEGEKLENKINRQKKQGIIYPTTSPHYSLSLVDVQVDDEYLGTPLAEYYGARVYQNKDKKHAITLESKSTFAPRVYHQQADGTAIQIEELPNELAVGQEVSVLIKSFFAPKYSRLGSSFDAILIPEGEIKYYSSGASSEIEAFGLKPSAEVEESTAQKATEEPTATTTEDLNNPFNTAPADANDVPEDAKDDTEEDDGAIDNPFVR